MKRKKTLYISIILILFLYSCNNFEYKLEDEFSESTRYGTIRFLFYEVNEYDKVELNKIAKNNNDSIFKLDTNKFSIVISHFYRLQDSATPKPNDIKKLKREYPLKPNLINKLLYIPNGYTFTGFSKKVEKAKIPQDTLTKTAIFVPKHGYKASDIMKK